MRQWWLCVSLLILCVNRELVFIVDSIHHVVTQFSMMISQFLVTQFSLTIHASMMTMCFAIDFRRQPWISFRWQFHASTMTLFSLLISSVKHELVVVVNSTSVITQFSMMISRSIVTQHDLVFIYDFMCLPQLRFWWWFWGLQWQCCRWFRVSTMTLFSLFILCINRELVFAVDSKCHPPLNFRWWFVNQLWHSVCYDSMHQPWL
jgi:hypothetical protein